MWPLIESRRIAFAEPIELRSTCEALAFAEGLSFDSSRTPIQLVRQTALSRTEHTFFATTEGNVSMRSTCAASLLGRFLDTLPLTYGVGAIAKILLSPLALAPATLGMLLAPFVVLVVAVACSLRLRTRRFQRDCARIAASVTTPTRTAVPYRVASTARFAQPNQFSAYLRLKTAAST